MVVTQAFRFALDPTPVQGAALGSHCGAARFVFNWGLARVKANLAQREAERSYGIPEAELTPSVGWSAYGLRKSFNQVKHEVAPWWADNSKEAYANGLAQLANALGNWNSSKRGARAGRRVGFPRFKSRRGRWSCAFTTGSFGLCPGDRRHVRLPRVGTVRTCESTRKLARRVEAGSARILRATVSWHRGRWIVSFTCEVTRTDRAPTRPDATVGVDLGVKSLAVLSTGDTVPNPKHLEHALRRLRRLQRQAARRRGRDRRTGQTPSKRWEVTQAEIARAHARVADARRDGWNQLTTRLAAEYGTVVVEQLNVAGMLRNHKLARSVADAGMSELRRQLTYKTTWRTGHLIVADRWFPSSKTCSACGAVKAKLRLRDRVFRCDNPTCGLTIDRDVNAALNLAALVEATVGAGERTSSQSCGATENEPDGNPHKTSPAGTGYRHGKTSAAAGAKVA